MTEHAGAVPHGWLIDLLELLSPDPDRVEVTGTPEEMIAAAAREAFLVSSAAALPPGPFGLLTLFPEFITVTRIQVHLVYRIARFHGGRGRVDRETLLLVFGEALGLGAGRVALRSVEKRLVARLVASKAVRGATRFGGLGRRFLLAGLVRWIPAISSPVFGFLSRATTRKIGALAARRFAQVIPESP